MTFQPAAGGTSSTAAATLTPTPVKTANYNAAASDLVVCDISAGSFTVTLPTAPANGAQVAVAVVKEAAFSSGQFSATFATIACGGSDVLLIAGGATSAIFGTGSITLQYKATGEIWYVLQSSGAPFLPRGFLFGYDQIVAAVNVASSTEATGTSIITAAAHTFDGSPVLARVNAPAQVGSSTSGSLSLCLFEGSTEVGRFSALGGANSIFGPVMQECVITPTPTAGAHTYKLTAFSNQLGGPPNVTAGAGGTAAYNPAALKFLKL